MEREKKLSILYQKQGRTSQFSSKAARDKSLEKEIYDLNDVLALNMKQEGKLVGEVQLLEGELDDCKNLIKARSADSETSVRVYSQHREKLNIFKAKRDKLQEERISLWKKEKELINEVDKLEAEVYKAEKSFDQSTPGDIRRGLHNVRRICQDKKYKISGVHGPIIELLDCDDKFFTAVEVTAGNSLFHIVVENDEISSKIIRILTAEKGGRVTFIPLNKVRAPEVTYPQNSTIEVVPLLKRLKFSSPFAPAFAQVFGRTVVCRNLDDATKVAHTNGLDCITLEGDQVSKKGGMTGGFYDYRFSKMKIVKLIRQNTIAINSKKEELESIREKIKDVDQEITRCVGEQEKIDAELGHLNFETEQINQDVANLKKRQLSLNTALDRKRKLLANCINNIAQLRAGIAVKAAEMKTDLNDQLTPEEREDLSRLNPEITELKEKLVACRANRVELETRQGEIQSNLSTNLIRREEELNARVAFDKIKALSAELELKKEKLNQARLSESDAIKQLDQLIAGVGSTLKEMGALKVKIDNLKVVEDKYKQTLQDEAKTLEQLLNKRNMLLAKQEEYMKKIRDLGSLPSDAFEKYKRKTVKELHKMLHNCNEQLGKFSHVNKKALDQYVNFTEQREELRKRQAELDAGDEKIRELISVLDQRKDESIERTFKGVAKNFREAFSEIVQGGYGLLVMMKKKDGDLGEDDGDDGPCAADPEGRVEKYIGVKVKVSFTGQGETQSMRLLSGGQKTVVALALIFAIQRCDPAPFYLFDEIDAALDPQYRTAVGNMIRRQADAANTQFITTTFRPELVKIADKIYGVTHKNRISRVDAISVEDALNFIEHDQDQQNA